MVMKQSSLKVPGRLNTLPPVLGGVLCLQGRQVLCCLHVALLLHPSPTLQGDTILHALCLDSGLPEFLSSHGYFLF